VTRLLTAILFSLAIISCDPEKKDTGKEQIDKVCDGFMDAFSKQRLTEAVELLRKHSVIGAEKIDTLQATMSKQLKNVFPAYGKMVSFQFISERKIKDFIVRRYYILKLEKYYVKFDFTLYKSPNGWTITSFNYNDELIELLF